MRVALAILFILLALPGVAREPHLHSSLFPPYDLPDYTPGGFATSDPMSQTYEGFRVRFREGACSDLTEMQLYAINVNYSSLLVASQAPEQLVQSEFWHGWMRLPLFPVFELPTRQKPRPPSYPLSSFATEAVYLESIRSLLRAYNLNHRLLAYGTIAAANDRSQIEWLRGRLASESPYGQTAVARALLHLRDAPSREMFEFVARHPGFESGFLSLDLNAAQEIAYEKLASDHTGERVLAIRTLAVAGLNPRTDRLVRDAVQSWEPALQVHAIEAMAVLRMSNVHPILATALRDKVLRHSALVALSSSPSPDDEAQFAALIPTRGEVPLEVLEACYRSKNPQWVRRWLEILREQPLSRDFRSRSEQPLLASDELLHDVRTTLAAVRNTRAQFYLLAALRGREDSETRKTLRETLSILIPAGWGSEDLLSLAIESRVDGLQSVFEPYLTGPCDECRLGALEYLSVFPIPEYRTCFRAALAKSLYPQSRRLAALGLGLLNDTESVDLIIEALQRDRGEGTIPYLQALARLKGPKAREAVERYQTSEVPAVRKAARELLESW